MALWSCTIRWIGDVRNGYHVYWWEVPTAVGTSVRDNVPVMYTQVSMAPGTEVGPRSVSETDRRASVGRTLEKLHEETHSMELGATRGKHGLLYTIRRNTIEIFQNGVLA